MQDLVCDALLNGKSLSVLVLLFANFICSVQVKGKLFLGLLILCKKQRKPDIDSRD